MKYRFNDNNVRSYPRTLNQAFGNTADYGCAIERTRPPFWTPIRVALALTYLLAFVTLGVVL